MEYVTTGEFERTMSAIRAQISEGFDVTHHLQRETNGRVLKAEKTLEVFNSARLIDRTVDLENHVRDLRHDSADDKATEKGARSRRSAWASSLRHAVLSVVGGALLLYISQHWLVH